MTVVSEAGIVTRTGKSKLRAIPAGEPKPKRAKAKAPTNCAICGQHAPKLIEVRGNMACETCALAVQADAPLAEAKQPRTAKKAPTESVATPEAARAPVPRSMAALAEGYATFMESNGKTPATVASYRNDLALAVRELGADTLVADLSAEQVGRYFESDPVMLLRSGGAKSDLSVAKTRRVLRLALVWAAGEQWIAVAPIPPAK